MTCHGKILVTAVVLLGVFAHSLLASALRKLPQVFLETLDPAKYSFRSFKQPSETVAEYSDSQDHPSALGSPLRIQLDASMSVGWLIDPDYCCQEAMHRMAYTGRR